MASNYQLSHLRPSLGSNPGLRGGRPECYHSATVAPCHGVENKIGLGGSYAVFCKRLLNDEFLTVGGLDVQSLVTGFEYDGACHRCIDKELQRKGDRIWGRDEQLTYLFIWDFTSLSTLYRSYHEGSWKGERKLLHTVRHGSVL